jgi:hypothetical protein
MTRDAWHGCVSSVASQRTPDVALPWTGAAALHPLNVWALGMRGVAVG